jgi:hypothetical protein
MNKSIRQNRRLAKVVVQYSANTFVVKSATFAKRQNGQNSTTFEGSYISGPPIFQEYSYNKINGYYISGIAEIIREGEIATLIIKN